MFLCTFGGGGFPVSHWWQAARTRIIHVIADAPLIQECDSWNGKRNVQTGPSIFSKLCWTKDIDQSCWWSQSFFSACIFLFVIRVVYVISAMLNTIKHLNDSRVSPKTVLRHNTWIVLFLTRHNESTNGHQKGDLHTLTSFLAHPGNVLVMAS